MPAHSHNTILLAADQQRSVLNTLHASRPHPIRYMPYGHRFFDSSLPSLLGFNGELPDSMTGHYHLGNGYRQFNPVLMRFNNPDSFSPFGKGGMNAYAYCLGDPVNRVEIKGQYSSLFTQFWKGLKNRIGVRTPSKFDGAKRARKQSESLKHSASMKQNPSKALEPITSNDSNKSASSTSRKNEPETPFAPNKPDERIRVTFITDPEEKLANLKIAAKNIATRLASDAPEERPRRQHLLDNVNKDIDQLQNQVEQIRTARPVISV